MCFPNVLLYGFHMFLYAIHYFFAHERAKHHATSHTASQQCIIPVEIAFMRHAAAEAGDINIMLCAQCVKHIIRQCLRITQIKIAFQNLR